MNDSISLGRVVRDVQPESDGSYRYILLRDGRETTVAVQLHDLSIRRLLAYSWSAFLTMLILLGIGWTVFLRRPRDPAAPRPVTRRPQAARAIPSGPTAAWLRRRAAELKEPSMSTDLSYAAPSSLGRSSQRLTACSHASRFGARGRPIR